MECTLNIDNLQTEDHSELIFYATHEILVYRQSNRIVLAQISGNILSEVKAPVDNAKYEFLDLGDAVLFLFNGMSIVLLDKTGTTPEQHSLDCIRIGRSLTRLYSGDDPDRIIFGTVNNKKVQFINYDFMQKQRVAQTASWEVSTITDMIVTEDMLLFAVLDQSTIVACDMRTGETLWTRFETSKIHPGIVYHNGELIYSCQGLFKKVGTTIEILRIPLISVNSIEHQDSHHVYFTSNENKNLCCYHTPTNKLKWELFGRHPIHESVWTYNTKKETLLLTRTDEYIGVINLSSAKSESSIRTNNIHRLRKTEDHILIQKDSIGTTLIPGVRNADEDN